jgi:hypothetical protein
MLMNRCDRAAVEACPLTDAFRDGVLDLRAALASTLPTPSRDDMERILANPALLTFDPKRLLGQINAWEDSVGPQADVEARTIVGLLRYLAEGGVNSLTYSCTSREHHGGRRMFWFVPDYRGGIVLSGRGEEKIRGRRYLLQAIPKVLRPAFLAPAGFLFVDVDIKMAHMVAAAALTRDQQLLADLDADMHQACGDVVMPQAPDPAKRRGVGKITNSLMLCGGGWAALQHEWASHGVRLDEVTAATAWGRWWSGYPVLASLRDTWWMRGYLTQHGLKVIRPDGTRFSFAPSDLHGQGHPLYADRGGRGARHAAAFRSSFSALWRAIESSVLDRALGLVYAMCGHGVRLCLPMYDGALFLVPENGAEGFAELLCDAFEQAAREAGLVARAEATTRRRWG